MTKKFLTVLIGLCMMLTILPTVALAADDVTLSGVCGADGDNLTWQLTERDDGKYTLTISGTGEMASYFNYNTDNTDYSTVPPWSDERIQIEDVIINEGVTSIGSYFAYESPITQVSIPDSVTAIGAKAFYGSGLTSVTIPRNIEVVSEYAFMECADLKTAIIEANITEDSNAHDMFMNSGLTTAIFADGVTTINGLMFAYANNLVEIVIPESLTKIEYGFNCSGLEKFTVASGNPMYTADDGVLFNKDKTELIAYPQGKTATEYEIPATVTSFNGITNYALQYVKIPDSVTELPLGAFSGCKQLRTIEIPDSVTTIGSLAFVGCSNLTSVTLSKNIETLPTALFYECKNLTSIVVPDGVKWISESAFGKCSSLTEVTLPASLTTIIKDAFGNCTSLTTVHYAGTEAQWEKINKYQSGLENAAIIFKSTGSEPGDNNDPKGAIIFTQTSYTINTGDEQVISAFVPDTNGFQQSNFTWSSSNENIAAVIAPAVSIDDTSSVATAVIKGIAAGRAEVTLTVSDGRSAKCEIIVNESGPSEGNTFIIYLEPNGGTIDTASLETDSDGKLAALQTPTRQGYTFGGWYTKPDGGTLITLDTIFTENAVIYAHWTSHDNTDSNAPGSSHVSSGGSSRRTSTAPVYAIVIPNVTGGNVTANPAYAAKGDKVTLTVLPDDGYIIDTVSVEAESGTTAKLTEISDVKYSFIMPGEKVTIYAEFTAVEMPAQQRTSAPGFIDVAEDAYYYEAVRWAVERGITSGTSANLFNPNAVCTRAEAVTFLWRMNGSPVPAGGVNPFADVTGREYYYDAVLWAVENGIVKGTSPASFSPDAIVTRGQAVSFLHRAAGSPASAKNLPFSDVMDHAYYAEAVQWAVSAGITSGTSATSFSPEMSCTRAQIVTFLYQAQGS